MKVYISVLSILLILSLGVISTAGAVEKPLIVGLLKPDKVIVPFAVFQNNQWKNPWPRPKYYETSPSNTVTGLAAPWFKRYIGNVSTWYLWGDGFQGTKLSAGKIVKTASHCGEEDVWGIAVTNALSSKVEVESRDKIGAVFCKQVTVSPFQKISASKSLEALIKPIFDKQEAKAIAAPKKDSYSYSFQQLFPKEANQRTSKNLNIATVYKAILPGSKDAIEYVIAERYYDNPRGSDCKLISYWVGWIFVGATSRVIQSDFTLTNCDHQYVPSADPFAIATVQGKSFIVVQENGYESESYTIYSLDGKISKLREAISTYGGGC